MIDQTESGETSELEIQIVNYVDEYTDSFKKRTPLPISVEKFLKDFNSYDLEEDIKQRGRNTISSELEKVNQLLESQEVEKALREGISIAQQLSPLVKIETFPIYLICAGKITNARAMYGGIVLNLTNLVNKPLNKEETVEMIKSMTAHETAHRLIRQLGLKPERYSDIDENLLHTIWEEGLTTTIETVHHPLHEDFVKDSEFWIQSIRDWMNTKGDDEKRGKILIECYKRDSFKKWLDKKGNKFEKLSSDARSNEEKFRNLLTFSNGPAYHVGYVLWKRELDRGKNITELMLNGDSQVREWLGLEVVV